MVRRFRRLSLVVALVLSELPVAVAAGPESPYPTDPERRDGDEPGPIAPVDDTPIELVLPPVSAALNARRLAAAGRDAEAALALEALFAQTGDLRFLYHAGLARSRAGDHALALRHFTLWLERSASAPEPARAYVGGKVLVESQQLAEFSISPLEGSSLVTLSRGPVTITLERLSPQGTPVPGVRWTEPLSQPLRLDPGPWRARLEAPGYLPVVYDGVAAQGVVWQVSFERQQIAVDLRFSPVKALRGARLVVRSSDNPRPVELARDLSGPTQTLMLPSGGYSLAVTARRHQAAREFTVMPGQGPIDVVLQPRVAASDKLKLEQKALLGVLSVFCVDYFTGIGLILGGVNVEGKAKDRNKAAITEAGGDPETKGQLDPAVLAAVDAAFPTADYHRRLALGSNLNAAGVIVAMSGLGLTMSMLPVMLKKTRRELMIPLGVGFALLGGGATWFAFFERDQRDMLAGTTADDRVTRAQWNTLAGPRLGSTLLMGLGIGMVAFPAGYMLGEAGRRRREARRLTLAPMTGPGRAGLVLGGQF